MIAWFSAGATSAVAAELAIKTHGTDRVRVVYCDTRSEHPDNDRFIADCELWLGTSITRLASSEYQDIWDVFARTGWLVGIGGARCTTELKKRPRLEYQRPDDVHVFGYDSSEAERIKRFRENNPEIVLETPLFDAGISKGQCIDRIKGAGIELPAMYRLGFTNNNCIGCVKGGIVYWLKIRETFPDHFDRMARIERDLDATICKRYINGQRTRLFLDELEPSMAKGRTMRDISCGMSCGQQELFPDWGAE